MSFHLSGHGTRLRVAGLACVVASLSAVQVAGADTTSNANGAATACAHGQSLNRALGASDVRFVHGYVSCVLTKLRRDSGHGIDIGVHGSANGELKNAIASSQQYDLASRLVAIGHQECGPGPQDPTYHFEAIYADSVPPPVLTLRYIASNLATNVFGSGLHAVGKDESTFFGVSVQRGRLFKGNNANGVAFAVVALRCVYGRVVHPGAAA